MKEVDITITTVWCPKCDQFIDIGDLVDDGDGGLKCDDCDSTLMQYDE